MAIAETFAIKKGYRSEGSGRPHTHRAALELLRDCIDGTVAIYWSPPNESSDAIYKQELADEEARLKRARDLLKGRPAVQIKGIAEEEEEEEEAEGDKEEEEEEEEEEDDKEATLGNDEGDDVETEITAAK
jgi:cobalamin biosynthesis protein CobT